MKPFAGMSASEITQGVHAGYYRVREVADVHLKRIAQFDHELRAFATVDHDLVHAEAAWLDAQRDAGARLPLHGVPVGVKDIIDVAGLPTIAGFEPYRDNIAQRDAEIVSRLRALGTLILGKTRTTQFAVGDPAPTRNPWNPQCSPAGSSAGSGSAVPARMVPIALGSQTAGSMLRPAAFNGCIGFKPTYGWMLMDGVLPLCWSLDHLGIYAGNVEDLALVYQSLTGRQSASIPNAPSTPRIGLLAEFLEMSDPDVATHLQNVATQLGHAGASVVQLDLPVPFEDIFAVHQVIFAAEMAAVHSANLSRYPEDYGSRIRTGVEAGALLPGTSVLHAHRLQREFTSMIDQVFSSFDALLMPTVSTEACDRAETGDRRFQVPATLLGLPAISLPTGFGERELPLGTQLIGRAGQDRDLLGLSAWVAEAVPLIDQPDLTRWISTGG